MKRLRAGEAWCLSEEPTSLVPQSWKFERSTAVGYRVRPVNGAKMGLNATRGTRSIIREFEVSHLSRLVSSYI
jgi:hypothetical protein